MTAKLGVIAFWEGMKMNDFSRAGKWLSEILKVFGLNPQS